MKARTYFLFILLIVLAAPLVSGISAYGATMNAGMSLSGSFSNNWIRTNPDILTTTALQFSNSTTNYNLPPSSATGDFAWNGVGIQPDYTMNPTASTTQYAGHMGGASSSLSVGNQTFDPAGNGLNFLTWYLDVPSAGKKATDLISFSLTQENVISKITSGNTETLSLYLLGIAVDADGHWSSTPAGITLNIIETAAGNNYAYSWTADYSPVPEPSSLLLFGIGLALLTTGALRRRNRKGRYSI